jgi:phosphatidylserine/phosphatidylglycerophosphate/cardiolipin synthase-like enzyme
VRIYLYPAPCVLHSKHFSIDDEVGVLSSSNMDKRSFGLNYEVSLMAVGLDIVGGLRKVEDTYREMSRELTIGERVRRPRRSRYVDNVMRLTAALEEGRASDSTGGGDVHRGPGGTLVDGWACQELHEEQCDRGDDEQGES